MTQTSPQSHGAHITATHPSVAPHSKIDKYSANPSGVVIGLTLGMAWQLAVVVLVPIFGGHFLDDKFNSSPVWTLIGFVVAMLLMVVVVRQTLARLAEFTGSPTVQTDDKTHKDGAKS